MSTIVLTTNDNTCSTDTYIHTHVCAHMHTDDVIAYFQEGMKTWILLIAAV